MVVTPQGSLQAATRAAGGAIYGVDKGGFTAGVSSVVISGEYQNAFVCVRPPGHHAGIDGLLTTASSCGFCRDARAGNLPGQNQEDCRGRYRFDFWSCMKRRYSPRKRHGADSAQIQPPGKGPILVIAHLLPSACCARRMSRRIRIMSTSSTPGRARRTSATPTYSTSRCSHCGRRNSECGGGG